MNKIEPYNFIVVSLCNNDYGYTIKEALEYAACEYGIDIFCSTLLKRFIIRFLISKYIIRDFFNFEKVFGEKSNQEDYIRFEGYLERNLRVTFERNAPTDDHDGGSAAYDIHRKYAFTF